MTIEKWLADVYYDDCGGTQIWSKDEDGGSQLVAEVRGWGTLQNEFKTNEEAERFQDEVGEFIVQAIREKIARTSSQTEISDDMIKEVGLRYCSNIEQQIGWYKAIEWYREQLKKKGNGETK